MKKVGIICEYNPLHNGHVYHFNKVREESKADIIILSMSSSFTQRGELNILSKFNRTKLALKLGIDLILECPTIFSAQEASLFAYYHVLNLALAKVDEIWIGSEENDSSLYPKYLSLIESSEFITKQKEFLNLGCSFKLSFSKALDYFNYTELKSNDLLGIYYYQAIQKIDKRIKLKTIKRIASDYNSSILDDSHIQSATAIRANLEMKDAYIPSYSKKMLEQDYLDENKLLPFIKYEITSNNNLNLINEASEGLENRLKSIIDSSSFSEAIELLKTKRYSSSKLRRLLFNTLFNISKDDFNSVKNSFNFIRVLGFNENGKSYLASIKKNTPIYTNIKDGLNPILDIELKISKILDIIYNINLIKLEQKGPITVKHTTD